MKKLTYKEAYDKIITAYFKDEIKPMNANFCFCGTLCGNTDNWFKGVPGYRLGSHGYTGRELGRMEAALIFNGEWWVRIITNVYSDPHKDYEDALFAGMCAALEVLKDIHRERGEDVDEVPGFTKREL